MSILYGVDTTENKYSEREWKTSPVMLFFNKDVKKKVWKCWEFFFKKGQNIVKIQYRNYTWIR